MNDVILGMTQRQYFAAQAMKAILSNPVTAKNPFSVACAAVDYADALLKVLDLEEQEKKKIRGINSSFPFSDIPPNSEVCLK